MAPVLLSNYGAFTSMQVEDGAVRGLDLHLERLEQEALTLFGVAVPEARLRERMQAALAGQASRFSLRVQLFLPTITHRTPDAMGQPSVLTVVSAPANPLCDPLRLQTQDYAREVPELKHNATLGLTRARRLAKEAGFDDALFVGPDGLVSEGSIWNIGFVENGRIVWPRAPMLRGVGQRLLESGFDLVGLDSETRPIDRAALAGFRQAFICNSATPGCPVANIDGRSLDVDPALIDRLQAAWASNAPQSI
ncbi:aminotransferase class IV family protein [Brevundimonas kwangchunensis]|uniref:Probable branched-chain-amino-acid aminotransferase n=1 Tax=Brevundimonas kwangchunensis TaxID=322163 RepID=A0ABN1H1Q5_9CAUL